MARLNRGLQKSMGKIFGESKVNTEAKEIQNNESDVQVVEKIVEVPVEKVVEKVVEVPVEKVVEKVVEVPVEKVVEKVVEVPVEKVVEKVIEVPVEKVVEVPVEKIVEKIVEVPSNENENQNESTLMANINFVQANPNQPRKNFNEEKLQELAESIRNFGIIEPLVVRKTGPLHYEVIAGERRLRAAKIAGMEQVPIIIKDYDERERKEVAIIENVQREDLNTVEKALGYKVLIDEYNMTQEELAKKIGKSRASITNTLRILSLDEKIIEMLRDGSLSEGHARALLSIEDAEFREKVAIKVIEEKLSVRKIEDMIRLEKLANYRKEKEKALNTEYFKMVKLQIKDIERQMKSKLSADLKISPKSENSGIVEIKYSTQEELDRIYLLINSIGT